ncbi:hypothetical protein PF010_g16985 [Phytophthora fragariae]|nr:hypothetical protein PF011_g7130 [Phytophthora fragariae]KAE9094714.1 hypothetical protein PF010_g16985 [Phytophthora fragariae]
MPCCWATFSVPCFASPTSRWFALISVAPMAETNVVGGAPFGYCCTNISTNSSREDKLKSIRDAGRTGVTCPAITLVALTLA